MKLPLQITFHGMEPSEALEAAVAKKAHKLEEFCSDIMSCRVVIEQLQKHQHQGRPFAVRINLSLPRHELCVNRVQDEDAYVALRDAFDDMKRQLEDAARAQARRSGACADDGGLQPDAYAHLGTNPYAGAVRGGKGSKRTSN